MKTEPTQGPINGFITAMRTLTALPIQGDDAREMHRALPWFPAVGFILGVLIYAVIVMVVEIGGVWPAAAAVAAVIAQAVLTRGLHLDGLADWADAFWGAHTRERTLEIMKDSRIGTFGTVALICALLGKWVCITRLIETSNVGWILGAMMVARVMMVYLSVSQTYARAEGGTANPFVENADSNSMWLATCGAFIAMLVIGLGVSALIAIILGFLVTKALAAWFYHRLGGITGDTLGATNEIVELTILAFGATIS